MRLIKRDSDKAYLDNWLWLPKSKINQGILRRGLSTPIIRKGELEQLRLWRESPSHLGVPRARVDLNDIDYEVVDLRPKSFPKAEFKSNIVLDKQLPDRDEQKKAFHDFVKADGGILNLSCVAGDTILNLNRNGKGFSSSIDEAHKKFRGIHERFKWNNSETYVRSKVGDEIRLNQIEDIIYKGKRLTIKINLDSQSIRLTPEHKVLTTRGWKEARQLTVGDQVITDGKREGSVQKEKKVYKRLSWYPSHPYARKQTRSNGDTHYVIEEHRAIAEAYLNNLTLEQFRCSCKTGQVEGLEFIDPNKYHVHHDDEDIHNNKASNLVIMEKTAHMAGHQPGYKAFGFGIPTPKSVVSIEKGFLEDVYDVVCKHPHHNFVANSIVVHNCGKGKTVICLHAIAEWGEAALVICNTNQLMQQWVEAATDPELLNMDKKDIGWIQGSPDKWNWKKPLVIASLKTLSMYHDRVPLDMKLWFGRIIWDEIHHLSAYEFSKTATIFPGNRYGATATVDREDGMEFVYYWHVGKPVHVNLEQDVIPTVLFKKSGTAIDLGHPEVVDVNGQVHHRKLAAYTGLRQRELDLALEIVNEGLSKGRDIVAITMSKDHAQRLHELTPNSGVLHSGIKDINERLKMLAEHKITYGTVDMLAEALNKKTLDSLFILTEFKSPKNAQQSTGRIQRLLLDREKKAKVVVLFHVNIPPMKRLGFKLMQYFKECGFQVKVR